MFGLPINIHIKRFFSETLCAASLKSKAKKRDSELLQRYIPRWIINMAYRTPKGYAHAVKRSGRSCSMMDPFNPTATCQTFNDMGASSSSRTVSLATDSLLSPRSSGSVS